MCKLICAHLVHGKEELEGRALGISAESIEKIEERKYGEGLD